MELAAAIAGTYYLKKVPALRSTRYLVTFLWITVVVEFVSSYAPIAYFSNYDYFEFVKGTKFRQNYWLQNPYLILSFAFYVYYFRSFIRDKTWRVILKYLNIAYLFVSIGIFLFSNVYFSEYSQFSSVAGTLLLILCIAIFYFELLKSDALLNLKRFLPLYISIGILIFSLCITPIDIFSAYLKETVNPFFVTFKNYMYLYVNIFLYSTYILGFIVCSRKKRSY